MRVSSQQELEINGGKPSRLLGSCCHEKTKYKYTDCHSSYIRGVHRALLNPPRPSPYQWAWPPNCSVFTLVARLFVSVVSNPFFFISATMEFAVRVTTLCFLLAAVAFHRGTCLSPGHLLPQYRFSFEVSPDVLDDGAESRVRRASGRGASQTTWACDTVTAVPEAVRAALGLDAFYAKYTHAYGIPVLSSNQTQDAALVRACYVVRFMLADRLDLRDAMHDRHGRVGLIGLTELTTDIPEHSNLNDFWNDRARGLGGTQTRPITTCGEENVLCLVRDRWSSEDVLVHEFAHAVHLISLRSLDGTFDQRLVEAFNLAKEEGLWNNTYAISRSLEYWAEGVQSFFNVQDCPHVPNGVHNTICTRDLLMGYDRRLYDLIVEAFPCKNEIVDRCDKETNLATATVRMNCDIEATSSASTGTPVSTVATSASSTVAASVTVTIQGTVSPPVSGASIPRHILALILLAVAIAWMK